jgi:hypothetical protein
VPQQDAHDRGEGQRQPGQRQARPGARLQRAPLAEQLVDHLGDPVIDHVAETDRQLVGGLDRRPAGLRAGRGQAAPGNVVPVAGDGLSGPGRMCLHGPTVGLQRKLCK